MKPTLPSSLGFGRTKAELMWYVKGDVDKGNVLKTDDHAGHRDMTLTSSPCSRPGRQTAPSGCAAVEKGLSLIAEVIEIWMEVAKWMYPESVFIGSEDIWRAAAREQTI